MNYTITKQTLLNLAATRKMQAEKLRADDIEKNEGMRPDCCYDHNFAHVEFQNGSDPFPRAVNVGLLAKWANLGGDLLALEFADDAITVRDGNSRVRLAFSKIEPSGYGIAIRVHATDESLEFRMMDGAQTLADVKAHKAAQSCERKVAKVKKLALDAKTVMLNLRNVYRKRHTEARSDAGSYADALAKAKLTLGANRLFRAAMRDPMTCPAWVPDGEYDDTWAEEHGDHVDRVNKASDELAAFKPRLVKVKRWNGELTGEVEKVYGPKFKKLESAIATAKLNLSRFISRMFKAHCDSIGIVCCAGDCRPWLWQTESRAFSRQRLTVRTWNREKDNALVEYLASVKDFRAKRAAYSAKLESVKAPAPAAPLHATSLARPRAASGEQAAPVSDPNVTSSRPNVPSSIEHSTPEPAKCEVENKPGRYSTGILKAPSGVFIVVGSVPSTCCDADGRQRTFDSEADALAAILADPWIQATPSQLIQLADCSPYQRESANPAPMPAIDPVKIAAAVESHEAVKALVAEIERESEAPDHVLASIAFLAKLDAIEPAKPCAPPAETLAAAIWTAITKAAADIHCLVRLGWTREDAIAETREKSTLGVRSWERVLSMLGEVCEMGVAK